LHTSISTAQFKDVEPEVDRVTDREMLLRVTAASGAQVLLQQCKQDEIKEDENYTEVLWLLPLRVTK